MKFPSALCDGDQLFLDFIGSKISEGDLTEFFKESGFVSPNQFPEKEIRKILLEKNFPSSNLYEIGWAVYECGTDRMRTYEHHIRIFASSIYIYTRYVQEWGGDWLGEYCYLMISDSIRNGNQRELRALAIFFEWLNTFRISKESKNNYPLLISWLLIKYRLNEAHEDFVCIVLDYLSSHINDQYMLVGDSYGFSVDDWFDLIELIPDEVCSNRDFLWDLIYRSDVQA